MNPKNRCMTPAQIKAELKSHTFLDPRWDATFKLLIADEEHPERLVHFLNSLLRLEGSDQITTAILQGTEQEVIFGFEKKVTFDLHCKNERDEPIVVEFQRDGDQTFKDRMLYYSAIAIRKEIMAGTIVYRLPQIYVLALMNFDLEAIAGKFHHTVKLMDIEFGTIFYDKLTFVYIELNQFKKSLQELETNEDRWLYALGNMGDAKERPTELSGPIFESLFESARISKFDSMKIDTLSAKLADEGIRNGELAYAINKGLAQGRAEGKVEGKVEGIVELIEERLRKGISWELITQGTGITPEEFERMKGLAK